MGNYPQKNERYQKPSHLSVMSAQAIASLKNIKTNYGDPPLRPQLRDFTITDENELQLIKSHNDGVRAFNKRQEIKTTFLSFLIGISVYVTGFSFVEGDWIGIWAFWGLAVAGWFGKKLAVRLVEPQRPIHKKTTLLKEYEKLIEEYPGAIQKYQELVELEKKDAFVRSQKDYWLSLSGLEFEEEMAKLYSKIGFKVQLTPGTGDGGIDLILTDDNGNRTVVQCKAHKKPVGPHVVRDLFGVMSSEKAKGILVSLGGFTQGVWDFANEKNIELIDMDGVIAIQESISYFKG